MNAIKYILEKRNMQQKDLRYRYEDDKGIKRHFEKQAISKCILRQRKINERTEKVWASLLNVPPEYFIDKNHFCKEMNDEDLYKLETYLIMNPYKGIMEDEGIYEIAQIQYIERLKDLEYDIKKTLKDIKNDIYKIGKEIPYESAELDIIGNKMNFYKQILEAKSSQIIRDDEWGYLFIAINAIKAGKNIESENPIAKGFYNGIREYREQNKKLTEEAMRLFDYNFDSDIEKD
ncbi:MAG: hypothetical protein IJ945_09065 [Oscillospiraceae bacterium]|nr:hypothetical protein [Oscillospiraceae bacterium]